MTKNTYDLEEFHYREMMEYKENNDIYQFNGNAEPLIKFLKDRLERNLKIAEGFGEIHNGFLLKELENDRVSCARTM